MAEPPALDIPEGQVLVFFEDDPVPWHPRLLTERLEGGCWRVATPTLDLEVTNLAEAEDVRPFDRGSLLPDACRPALNFDAVSAEDKQRLRGKCSRYSDDLGVTVAGNKVIAESGWVYGDTGQSRFGDEVPEALAGGQAILRGGAGLLLQAKGLNDAVIERAGPADKGAVARRKTGERWARPPPQCPRLGGRERLRLGQAFVTMRMAELDNAGMFWGPSALREVLEAMRSAASSHRRTPRTTCRRAGSSSTRGCRTNPGTWWLSSGPGSASTVSTLSTNRRSFT